MEMGEEREGKGHVGTLEGGSSSEDVAFVLVEKKKLDGLQKKVKAAKKRQ